MHTHNVHVYLSMKNAYIITSILFIIYLIIPSPGFPKQLSGSLQSIEPADKESFYRRSYFLNSDRSDVLEYFTSQYKYGLFRLPFLTYRLNYPPEEAQTLIRDQTRSTYLEEIVHPFRESLFVNGYEPKENKDVIFVENVFWKFKVTVKQIESNVVLRLAMAVVLIIFIPFLYSNTKVTLIDFANAIKKIWKN